MFADLFLFFHLAVWTNMAQDFGNEKMIERGMLDETGNRWDKFKWKTLAQGAST